MDTETGCVSWLEFDACDADNTDAKHQAHRLSATDFAYALEYSLDHSRRSSPDTSRGSSPDTSRSSWNSESGYNCPRSLDDDVFQGDHGWVAETDFFGHILDEPEWPGDESPIVEACSLPSLPWPLGNLKDKDGMLSQEQSPGPEGYPQAEILPLVHSSETKAFQLSDAQIVPFESQLSDKIFPVRAGFTSLRAQIPPLQLGETKASQMGDLLMESERHLSLSDMAERSVVVSTNAASASLLHSQQHYVGMSPHAPHMLAPERSITGSTDAAPTLLLSQQHSLSVSRQSPQLSAHHLEVYEGDKIDTFQANTCFAPTPSGATSCSCVSCTSDVAFSHIPEFSPPTSCPPLPASCASETLPTTTSPELQSPVRLPVDNAPPPTFMRWLHVLLLGGTVTLLASANPLLWKISLNQFRLRESTLAVSTDAVFPLLGVSLLVNLLLQLVLFVLQFALLLLSVPLRSLVATASTLPESTGSIHVATCPGNRPVSPHGLEQPGVSFVGPWQAWPSKSRWQARMQLANIGLLDALASVFAAVGAMSLSGPIQMLTQQAATPLALLFTSLLTAPDTSAPHNEETLPSTLPHRSATFPDMNRLKSFPRIPSSSSLPALDCNSYGSPQVRHNQAMRNIVPQQRTGNDVSCKAARSWQHNATITAMLCGAFLAPLAAIDLADPHTCFSSLLFSLSLLPHMMSWLLKRSYLEERCTASGGEVVQPLLEMTAEARCFQLMWTIVLSTFISGGTSTASLFGQGGLSGYLGLLASHRSHTALSRPSWAGPGMALLLYGAACTAWQSALLALGQVGPLWGPALLRGASCLALLIATYAFTLPSVMGQDVTPLSVLLIYSLLLLLIGYGLFSLSSARTDLIALQGVPGQGIYCPPTTPAPPHPEPLSPSHDLCAFHMASSVACPVTYTSATSYGSMGQTRPARANQPDLYLTPKQPDLYLTGRARCSSRSLDNPHIIYQQQQQVFVNCEHKLLQPAGGGERAQEKEMEELPGRAHGSARPFTTLGGYFQRLQLRKQNNRTWPP